MFIYELIHQFQAQFRVLCIDTRLLIGNKSNLQTQCDNQQSASAFLIKFLGCSHQSHANGLQAAGIYTSYIKGI